MNIKRKGSRGAGAALLFVSIAAFITYAYFLLGTGWGMLILQFTVLAAVAILLTVLGWIGYTMLTAPREEEKPG
jgi:membrane protein implicated in regulation of membrane protease activity